ncbi:MAG: DUF3800 domain-containing protein [Myxococcota bacterium]|nr:DUF3800 domain-containing protein [Myxococcota bacterium]
MSKRPKIRYADLLKEIASGSAWSVFVDDTGPAGCSASPETLPPDRRTYVSVVLSPEDGRTLMEQMPGFLQELRSVTGASELHCSDLYAGKGELARTPLAVRLAALEAMAEIFAQHRFPVLVQSVDSASAKELIRAFGSLERSPRLPFRFDHFEDIALFVVLLRTRWYLKERASPDAGAIVFVDEGWKPNGIALRIGPWSPMFKYGCIFFGRSEDIVGLQLADFAGFILTRSQLLLGKTDLSPLDLAVLEIGRRLCFVNLNTVEFSLAETAPGRFGLGPTGVTN